jgi:hypothetical protein
VTGDPLVDRKKVLELCDVLRKLGEAVSVNELASSWQKIGRLEADIRHGLMVNGANATGFVIGQLHVDRSTAWVVELYSDGEWWTPPHYEWDSLDEAMDVINGDGHVEYRRRLVRVDERRTVIKVRGAHEKTGANDK